MKAQAKGCSVSHLHLRHINPFPLNLGEILVNYENILIPELNMGQLSMIIRSRFLVDAISLNKVQGKPFNKNETLCKNLQSRNLIVVLAENQTEFIVGYMGFFRKGLVQMLLDSKITNNLLNDIKSINIDKKPRSKVKPSDHTPIELIIN